MERITIATLNIAAASKERARRILDEWVTPSSFDVYVLTERSDGDGTQLVSSEFKSAGWTVFQRPTASKDRGVAIATRIAASEFNHYPIGDPAPGRTLIIDLDTKPTIRIIGMYVPNRGNDPTKTERKRMFLDVWLRHLASSLLPLQPYILLGDLNVVPPSQRPQMLPQLIFEYDWYQMLQNQAGLYDAALKHNSGGHESTWVSNTREGYTYDHVLLQKTFSEHVIEFKYDHSTRQPGGITDHSALILALQVDVINHLHKRPLSLPKQATLF